MFLFRNLIRIYFSWDSHLSLSFVLSGFGYISTMQFCVPCSAIPYSFIISSTNVDFQGSYTWVQTNISCLLVSSLSWYHLKVPCSLSLKKRTMQHIVEKTIWNVKISGRKEYRRRIRKILSFSCCCCVIRIWCDVHTSIVFPYRFPSLSSVHGASSVNSVLLVLCAFLDVIWCRCFETRLGKKEHDKKDEENLITSSLRDMLYCTTTRKNTY